MSCCVRNTCASVCVDLLPLSLCLCRAIIIRNNEVIPMTNEFTPESERQRLQYLVLLVFFVSHGYVTNMHAFI